MRHAAGVKRVGPAADREQKTRWAAGAQTENLQHMRVRDDVDVSGNDRDRTRVHQAAK